MSDKFKYNSLGAAIKADDAQELEKMLKSDNLIFNSEEEFQNTINLLLFHAASSEEIDCMRVLLDNGANPNYKDIKTGETVIFQAIKFNSEENFSLLVEKGADIDTINSDGNNVIVQWLRNQYELEPNEDGHFHYDIIKTALDKGIKVDSNNLHQRNIIHEAFMMFEALYDYGVLSESAIKDVETMVDYMVLKGVSLDQEDLYGKIPAEYIPGVEELDSFFDHFEAVRDGGEVLTQEIVENKVKNNSSDEDKTIKMKM